MAASERAIRAGRAAIELFLDDEGLKRQLAQTRRHIQSVGQTLLSVGAQLSVIGGAIAGPFALAISSASDFEETLNKFQVVFGSLAGETRAWAEEFAASVGRSKTEVLRFLAETQGFLVPIGIDPRSAAELSKTLTQLAVDIGSLNNVGDAEVLENIKSALRGEVEPLSKYGIIVSEAAVKTQLLAKGLDDLAATNADKVMARYEIIMRDSVAAQGDAIRTADGFANQMKRLKSQAIDVATSLGQSIIPSVTEFVQVVNSVLGPLARWTEAHPRLVAGIAAAGAAVLTLGVSVTTLGIGVSALATAFAALGAVISAIGAPFLLAGAAITGIVATAGVALLAFSDWEKLLRELGETAKVTFEGMESALQNASLAEAASIAALGMKVAFLQAFKEISDGARQLFVQLAGETVFEDSFSGPLADIVKKGADQDNPFTKLINETQAQIDAIRDGQQFRDLFGSFGQPGVITPSPVPVNVEEIARAQKEMQGLRDEADRVKEAIKTAEERFIEAEKRLGGLKSQGLITPEEYERAIELERKKRDAEKDSQVRQDKSDADSIRESLKSSREKFEDLQREIEQLGSKGLLQPGEVERAIENARQQLLGVDQFTRRSQPVFAEFARFGLGGQDVEKAQLDELKKIRRAAEKEANRRQPRVGR